MNTYKLIFLSLLTSLVLNSCVEERIDNLLHNNNLAAADYWSDTPEILSAGVGFADIIAIDVDINKENALAAGAAWLDDMGCDPGDEALFTMLTDLRTTELFYKGQLNTSH
jgi:hypothetical protein